MAYEYVYLPQVLLPFYPQRKTHVQTIPNGIQRENPEIGAALQKTMYDPVLTPVTGTYYLRQSKLDMLVDFYTIIGGRSFWLPFPNPRSSKFTKDKWWYGRINPDSTDAIANPQIIATGLFSVTLKYDFWNLVPGVAPPYEAVGCDNG